MVAVAWIVIIGIRIWSFANEDHATPSDSIIVLGAAVYGDKPSPVFEERIKHGVTLYQQGFAPKIIFTGGRGEGDSHSEGEVGAIYAMSRGVPEEAILIESASRTTRQNLINAKVLMDESGLKSAIIVSDPLHLKRALMMANDVGIQAVSSPTPTSRYRSLKPKLEFLVREMYFYNHYLVINK
ncbi:protein sanA-like protein [Leucothrix pacifica]|uniref:Protein sanA-like protein n=2 Tax=Leucothrix pacifica TaxID=1247513 RepID=A0A317C7R0_9GAMM|nr:protein sanA-like protein [Leucothrix pacifica]